MDPQIVTFADRNYFLGVLALVNSLRLVGETATITVLDLGLTTDQRALLERECAVVNLQRFDDGGSAFHMKPAISLLDFDGVVAVIDSDIIVTSSLRGTFAIAAEGRVCVYPDGHSDKWFAEWSDIFDLGAPLRREQQYANAGFVVLSTRVHPTLLGRWRECCERIADQPMVRLGPLGPTSAADQDALNALLMSEIEQEKIALLPVTGEPIGEEQLARTSVRDLATLDCVFEGMPVSVLHNIGQWKPWQRTSWAHLRRTAYLICLRRVLTGPDVALPVDFSELPLWLRPGAVASSVRWLLYLVDFAGRARRSIRARARHWLRRLQASNSRDLEH